MSKSKILLVEDDADIREGLGVIMRDEGYLVAEAGSGEEAVALFDDQMDLVILDIMLPGISGFDVLEELRKRSNVPVLFLTAKSQEQDMMRGLEGGADDYLTKPFSHVELLARARALIRRRNVYDRKERRGSGSRIREGDLELDEDERCVAVGGKRVELTEIEYGLLRLFMKNPGKVFTIAQLYEEIWEEPYHLGANNTVMVHIRRLRKKLEEDPQNPRYVKTVWGRGYKFEAECL